MKIIIAFSLTLLLHGTFSSVSFAQELGDTRTASAHDFVVEIKSISISGDKNAKLIERALLVAFLKAGAIVSSRGLTITGEYRELRQSGVKSSETPTIISLKLKGRNADDLVCDGIGYVYHDNNAGQVQTYPEMVVSISEFAAHGCKVAVTHNVVIR